MQDIEQHKYLNESPFFQKIKRPRATMSSKKARRISFSEKKSVKEFTGGENIATIWHTSYEESDGSNGCTSSAVSTSAPAIVENTLACSIISCTSTSNNQLSNRASSTQFMDIDKSLISTKKIISNNRKKITTYSASCNNSLLDIKLKQHPNQTILFDDDQMDTTQCSTSMRKKDSGVNTTKASFTTNTTNISSKDMQISRCGNSSNSISNIIDGNAVDDMSIDNTSSAIDDYSERLMSDVTDNTTEQNPLEKFHTSSNMWYNIRKNITQLTMSDMQLENNDDDTKNVDGHNEPRNGTVLINQFTESIDRFNKSIDDIQFAKDDSSSNDAGKPGLKNKTTILHKTMDCSDRSERNHLEKHQSTDQNVTDQSISISLTCPRSSTINSVAKHCIVSINESMVLKERSKAPFEYLQALRRVSSKFEQSVLFELSKSKELSFDSNLDDTEMPHFANISQEDANCCRSLALSPNIITEAKTSFSALLNLSRKSDYNLPDTQHTLSSSNVTIDNKSINKIDDNQQMEQSLVAAFESNNLVELKKCFPDMSMLTKSSLEEGDADDTKVNWDMLYECQKLVKPGDVLTAYSAHLMNSVAKAQAALEQLELQDANLDAELERLIDEHSLLECNNAKVEYGADNSKDAESAEDDAEDTDDALDADHSDDLDDSNDSNVKQIYFQPFRMGILPLIPPIEMLLDNKFETEQSNWQYYNLHFYSSKILFRHRNIRSALIEMTFGDYEDNVHNFGMLRFNSVKMIKCPRASHKWGAIYYLRHITLEFMLPYDLKSECPTSMELFNFLVKMDELYQTVFGAVKQLMDYVIANDTLLHLDERGCVLHRTLFNAADYSWKDIVIKLEDIRNIGPEHVFVTPVVEFNDNIHSLPIGIEFVNKFLSEPNLYLKSSKG